VSGPEGLRLWTFASNAGAQRFYERHGFVETRRTDGRDNEERAPDILYVWGGDATPQAWCSERRPRPRRRHLMGAQRLHDPPRAGTVNAR
jgi:hypothetical protein